MFFSTTPLVFTFVSAELLFLLVRSSDIIVLVKSDRQRSNREKHRARRGLLRAVLLEATVFVPASATLLLLTAPQLFPAALSTTGGRANYALLGILSYGFPFATLRAMITRIALNTLREFALLVPTTVKEEDE